MATTATKEKNPIAIFNAFMEDRSTQLSKALPKHIPPDRFIRVVINAVQTNPDLLACNRQSLWNACMKAAQDGLLPDGREGAIVPFKDTATWMIMIAGMLKRFRNSGQFKTITANIVREGEQFEYFIDENGEHLRHTPGDGSGKPVKCYAIATTQADGTMIKVMTVKEIEQRRNASRAKNSPMWNEWWDEAAMKTVLRNLHKRLPSSSDLDDLIRRDDELYSFDTPSNNPTRITDVHSALDSFSGSSPLPRSNPETSSESDHLSNPRDASESDDKSNPKTESDNPIETETDEAFERGVEAKRDGMARKAVPPEYRAPDKSHLAHAWWKGWDSV